MIFNLFQNKPKNNFVNMIDTHCHILPGIDDGAKNINESLVMAHIAVNNGISGIIATPHVRGTLHPPDYIKKKCDELNHILITKKINLTIYPGAEVSSILPDYKISQYPLNHKSYILLELPHTHVPVGTIDKISNLCSMGFKVIIAHPERNPDIIYKPSICKAFVDEGKALLQITADSINGTFGRQIKKCATILLEKGYVSIIASDSHSSLHRVPKIAGAARKAEKILGYKSALALVYDNPCSVVNGEDIGTDS